MADRDKTVLPFTAAEREPATLQLSAEHLLKVYKGRRVVRDVSVDIRQAEIVGLLGPNGAGKTTTFYMIVGLVRPDAGRVLLGDDDITQLPMYLRAQRGISYLPQEASVFRKLTVEENLLAVFEIQRIVSQLRSRGIGILITDHNVRETLKITDRAYIIKEGEIFRQGVPESLSADAEVRRIYLGESFNLS